MPEVSNTWEEPYEESFDADGALLPLAEEVQLLRQQMLLTQSRIAALEFALNAFEIAIAGLDSSGHAVFLTHAMKQLATSNRFLRLSENRLELSDPTQNKRLQSAIAGAVSGTPSRSSKKSFLVHRTAEPPCQLTVAPHRSGAASEGAVSALVFLGDPSRGCSSRTELLRDLYNLSPAESRVADMLGQGFTVREAAAKMNISEGTARFHTKRIVSKTGTHRQVELIKLMLALPGLAHDPLAEAFERKTRSRGRIIQLPVRR